MENKLMAELSPAAKAIRHAAIDAYHNQSEMAADGLGEILAAAFRALAEQAAESHYLIPDGKTNIVRVVELLRLAGELDPLSQTRL